MKAFTEYQDKLMHAASGRANVQQLLYSKAALQHSNAQMGLGPAPAEKEPEVVNLNIYDNSAFKTSPYDPWSNAHFDDDANVVDGDIHLSSGRSSGRRRRSG